MPKPFLTPADFDRIAAMRYANYSYERIGRALRCSGKTVGYHCLRLGIEKSKPGRLRQPLLVPITIRRRSGEVRLFTYQEDNLILQLAMAAASTTEIARALGRRFNSVKGRLMTLARHQARAEEAA